MKSWRETAKERMAELGLKHEDLIAPLGVKTRGAVSHYLAGRRTLKAEQGESLASFLGLTHKELFGGHEDSEKLHLVGAGFTNLEEIDIGGKGAYKDDKTYFPVSDRFLIENGISPEYAAVLVVSSNSMTPTIQRDDWILVSTDMTKPISGLVYVFALNNDVRIGRFHQMLNGNWRVISDNPDKHLYRDEEISSHELCGVNIIGAARVIFKRTL